MQKFGKKEAKLVFLNYLKKEWVYVSERIMTLLSVFFSPTPKMFYLTLHIQVLDTLPHYLWGKFELGEISDDLYANQNSLESK